jgi:hypothetical protein
MDSVLTVLDHLATNSEAGQSLRSIPWLYPILGHMSRQEWERARVGYIAQTDFPTSTVNFHSDIARWIAPLVEEPPMRCVHRHGSSPGCSLSCHSSRGTVRKYVVIRSGAEVTLARALTTYCAGSRVVCKPVPAEFDTTKKVCLGERLVDPVVLPTPPVLVLGVKDASWSEMRSADREINVSGMS